MGLFNFPGVGEVSDTTCPPFFKGTVPLVVLLCSHCSPFPVTLPSRGARGYRLLLLHPGFGQEKDFIVVSWDTDPNECWCGGELSFIYLSENVPIHSLSCLEEVSQVLTLQHGSKLPLEVIVTDLPGLHPPKISPTQNITHSRSLG